jgi:ATP-dependent DNA ligase
MRFSESFPDADALLAECSRRGLEGVVAKRKAAPYRSGMRSGWVKVKTPEWRADNRWRGEFFGGETSSLGVAAVGDLQ